MGTASKGLKLNIFFFQNYITLKATCVEFNCIFYYEIKILFVGNFQRVYEGNYAYVTDLTSVYGEMAKHCDIARMDETFYPSQYACGAQKNSAYTAPVSDSYVKYPTPLKYEGNKNNFLKVIQ